MAFNQRFIHKDKSKQVKVLNVFGKNKHFWKGCKMNKTMFQNLTLVSLITVISSAAICPGAEL